MWPPRGAIRGAVRRENWRQRRQQGASLASGGQWRQSHLELMEREEKGRNLGTCRSGALNLPQRNATSHSPGSEPLGTSQPSGELGESQGGTSSSPGYKRKLIYALLQHCVGMIPACLLKPLADQALGPKEILSPDLYLIGVFRV